MKQSKRLGARRSLADVRRDLQRWRRSRGSPGGRIPEAFWEDAVALTEEVGVEEVVESLGLKRIGLERRLRALADETGPVEDGGDAPDEIHPLTTFVEVGPLGVPDAPADACVLELEDAQGGRLRIRVRENGHDLDLAGIVAAWRHSS